MKIFIAGGLGYIGSHTVVELLNNDYEVVVADNLSNSTLEILDNIKKITGKTFDFFETDVRNYKKTKEIFEKYDFDGIIHFAGFKAVGESVTNPLKYYENNLLTTINLSIIALEFNINNFIFSSSATVYGSNKAPFKEEMELLPTSNPYGETKAICERILKDTAKANENFNVAILRYFNPVGSHKSGLLLEQPKGRPNNLVPFISEVARGKEEKVFVFGDDYDTIDGTGVRDYIHVIDLAKGHISAFKNRKMGVNIYNIGTGVGYSVLEVISSFEKVHNIKIPFEVIGRREGDFGSCYADCTKAEKELGFKANYNIDEMCKDAFINDN